MTEPRSGLSLYAPKNIEFEVSLLAPVEDGLADETLSGYAALLLQRLQDADPAPSTFDSDQFLPGNPRPWNSAPQRRRRWARVDRYGLPPHVAGVEERSK